MSYNTDENDSAEKSKKSDAVASGKKLYVGNLPFSTTENDLQKMFAEFGEIEDLVIIFDRDTGRSKGFGFVTFADENSATAAAKALDGKDFSGRPMRVNVAQALVKRTGGGGGYNKDRKPGGFRPRNNDGGGYRSNGDRDGYRGR